MTHYYQYFRAKQRLLCLLSFKYCSQHGGFENWGISFHVTRLGQYSASENISQIIMFDIFRTCRNKDDAGYTYSTNHTRIWQQTDCNPAQETNEDLTKTCVLLQSTPHGNCFYVYRSGVIKRLGNLSLLVGTLVTLMSLIYV